MPDSDDKHEEQNAGRQSGATRRIVVQDDALEKIPRALGRKLETPQATTGVPPPHRETNVRSGSREPVNVKRIIMIAGGLAGILILVPLVAVVFHSVRNKGTKTQTSAGVSRPTPTGTPESQAAVQISPPQASTPSPEVDSSIVEDSSSAVEPAKIRLMALQLASQISQKSGYEFGPEFVELIRGRTQEYRSEKALSGARQYRREINKSFRDEGINPLFGYVLAMSRSKFDSLATQNGVGIWQLPVGVVRSQGYLGASDNSAKLKVPEVSAQIAASYSKQLLSSFDADDFMYAVACFGMNLQEAGYLQARLVNAAPDAKGRRDIMKIIRTGVLNGEQVDNLARFFAAGIVGENPQEFGLSDSQPFSSLY
jgi:hypothetical protein